MLLINNKNKRKMLKMDQTTIPTKTKNSSKNLKQTSKISWMINMNKSKKFVE